MEQNTIELRRFRRFLRNCPGLVFDNVFVYSRNQFPDIFEAPRKVVIVEIRSIARDDPARKLTDFGISLRHARCRKTAGAVLGKHGDSAAEEIAQIIRQIAVSPLNNGLDSEVAILAEHHFPQEVIAQELRSKNLIENEGIHDVTARLRHLHVLR